MESWYFHILPLIVGSVGVCLCCQHFEGSGNSCCPLLSSLFLWRTCGRRMVCSGNWLGCWPQSGDPKTSGGSGSQETYLIGGLEPWNFMTFHISGITSPTDLDIFQRGGSTTNQLQLLTPILDVFHTSCAGHHSHIRWRSCHRNQNTFCSSDVGFSSLPQDVYAGDEGEAKSSNRIAWQKPRGVQSSTGFSRARKRSAAEDFGCERGLSITLVRWILHGEFAYRMHRLHKGTASNSSSRGPSSLFRSPWLCDELYWSSAALWPNGLEGKGLQMSHVGSFGRISIHSWYSHIFITVELDMTYLDMVAGDASRMAVMHPWGLLWLSGAGSEGAWAHFRKREKMAPCLTTTATATVVLEVSMNTLFAGETCKGFESFRILNSFRLFCGWNAVRSTERPGVASIRSSCSWNMLEPLRPKSRGKVGTRWDL